MPNLVKYALFLAADVAIIGCVTHYCFMKLHWHLPSFPPFKDRFHTLTNNSYCTIVVLGVALALYGSLSFLFSWMPQEWIEYDEDGNAIWIAETLSTVGAFFGMIGLLSGLEHSSNKLSELQIRAAKSAEFEKLIKRELNEIRWIVRDPEMAAKVLRTLELEIREADKKRLIYNDDAGVCLNMLGIFQTAISQRCADAGRPEGSMSEPVLIQSTDFWVKVSVQEIIWALIELTDTYPLSPVLPLETATPLQSHPFGVSVYFINDTSGVFDEIPLPSKDEAHEVLRRNGFDRFADDTLHYFRPPSAPFHRAADPNGGRLRRS